MHEFTDESFDTFKRKAVSGAIMCPHGDYRLVKNVPDSCHFLQEVCFGAGVNIGHCCKFHRFVSIGNYGVINSDCLFLDTLSMGRGCTLYSMMGRGVIQTSEGCRIISNPITSSVGICRTVVADPRVRIDGLLAIHTQLTPGFLFLKPGSSVEKVYVKHVSRAHHYSFEVCVAKTDDNEGLVSNSNEDLVPLRDWSRGVCKDIVNEVVEQMHQLWPDLKG